MREFVKQGWKAAAVALPGENLSKLESPDVLTVAGDLCAEETRRAAIERTLARFGRIDVLVNNAAVGLYAPPSRASVELTRRLFDVNVFSALALTQLVIPVMRRQGSGTIVSMGSVGGYVSLPWAAVYCASKFTLHALNDSLRRELAKDRIHVMEVCPGIVDTRFRDHVLEGDPPAEVVSIRRVVSPEAVAKAVVRGVECRSRTVYIPGIGRLFTAMDFFAPWLMDWYLAKKW